MSSGIILPKKEIYLSVIKEINEICKPLQALGITYFNYLKVYKDGSRFDLNTDTAMAEYYYYNTDAYKNQAMEWVPFCLKEGFLLWSSIEKDHVLPVLREDFNTDHGITLIDHGEDVSELYHFASTRNNYSVINFYLNNQDILKLFISYFKDKAAKQIQFGEDNLIKVKSYEQDMQKYLLNNPNNLNLEHKNNVEVFVNTLDMTRYFLNKKSANVYLTKKELECIKWCVRGKTAEEIAMILNISKRTCETHIENIKLKLGCYKQLALGYEIANALPAHLLLE